MTWEEATKLAVHCPDALPATLTVESTSVPRPDLESVLMCKIKVRQGKEPDGCDQDHCPHWH